MEINIEDCLSVTIFSNTIKRVIDNSDLLHNTAVFGEVSGIKCSGAHSYFTIKDENTQLSCCCFNYKKTYLPKDGECVILIGGVDFYAKGGKLTFIANKIQPLGKGLLAIKFEQLKKKLYEEGLFDAIHKIAVPEFCINVGVITSKTGAVIKDIVSTIRKNNQLLNVCLHDCLVQGERASTGIIKQLKIADTCSYDAIIIARGGGSLEDLMAFNDEKLVYAIFNAKTPIISAVGHETDFTLCDFVADIRVPTPTAAAERVAFNEKELKMKVEQIMKKLALNLSKAVENKYLRLQNCTRAMSDKVNMKFNNGYASLKNVALKMEKNIESRLVISTNKLQMVMSNLDNNNPIKILSQGYFKVSKNAKNIIVCADLKIGDRIEVIAVDGKIDADVVSIVKNK